MKVIFKGQLSICIAVWFVPPLYGGGLSRKMAIEPEA